MGTNKQAINRQIYKLRDVRFFFEPCTERGKNHVCTNWPEETKYHIPFCRTKQQSCTNWGLREVDPGLEKHPDITRSSHPVPDCLMGVEEALDAPGIELVEEPQKTCAIDSDSPVPNKQLEQLLFP